MTQYILTEDIGSLTGPTQEMVDFSLPQAHSEIVLSYLHFITQNLSQHDHPVKPRCLCTSKIESNGVGEDGNATYLEYAILFWNEHLAECKPFHQLQLRALHKFSNSFSNVFKEWVKLRASMDFALKICLGISEDNVDVSPLEIAVYSGDESWTNAILESEKEGQLEHIIETVVRLSAERGFTSIMRRLFETGNWLECKNSIRRTPLHLAARNGHAKVVKFLLNCKANLNAIDGTGHSTLMHASSRGHVKVVKDLLLAGADTSAKTSSGFCGLSEAAANGYLQVVKCLVECSPFTVAYGQSLLFASANGYEDIVQYLLTKGDKAASCDSNHWIALYWATRNGHNGIAKVLLLAGADFNAIDRLNRTPLSRSARNGHLDCVNILLAEEADPGVADIYGLTPLHYAAMNGHATVILALEAAGAELDLGDSRGRRPLQPAVSKSYESIVTHLIGAGVDLDVQDDDDNNSALHQAVAGGFESIVNLLQAGADSLISKEVKLCLRSRKNTFEHYTPLCSALERGQYAVAWTLLRNMEALVRA